MPPKLKRNEILMPLLLAGGLTILIILVVAAQVLAKSRAYTRAPARLLRVDVALATSAALSSS